MAAGQGGGACAGWFSGRIRQQRRPGMDGSVCLGAGWGSRRHGGGGWGVGDSGAWYDYECDCRGGKRKRTGGDHGLPCRSQSQRSDHDQESGFFRRFWYGLRTPWFTRFFPQEQEPVWKSYISTFLALLYKLSAKYI
jgi:hypothetical protein